MSPFSSSGELYDGGDDEVPPCEYVAAKQVYRMPEPVRWKKPQAASAISVISPDCLISSSPVPASNRLHPRLQ